MDLLLTGTGPASGFPVPGCPCATCRAASTRTRSQPAELRIGERYRLDVDGVLHEPGAPPHRLQPGDRLDLPGLAVRAVRAVRALGPAGGPAVLVLYPDTGPALLWAPQAGRLPEPAVTELAGTDLGIVILGPAPDSDPDETGPGPTPVECALSLARLRAVSAASDRTACYLVGLGHRQGPAEQLEVCLDHWRVLAPADGTRLTASGTGAPVPGPNGRTLVLGGSASGKSGVAEDLLAAEPAVLYTATGPVLDLRTAPDPEWERRVRRHRERRPHWWQTEETHLVAAQLARADQPILLDSVGTWLTGVLDRAGAWHDQDGWRDQVAAENDALVRAWRSRRAPLVAVSDEVGLGVVPATPAGRMFRDELGRLNRRLAQESDQVLLVVAGRLLSLRVTGPGPGPQ